MQRALTDRAVAVVRASVRPQNALHLVGGHRFHRAEPSAQSKSISSVTSARALRRSGNDGKRIFFEKIFKTSLSEDDAAELKDIPNLAPGDFRTVRQEQFYLGEDQTNFDIIWA